MIQINTIDDIGYIPPGERLEDWIVVEEGSVAYDKDSALLRQFKIDFPNITLLGKDEEEEVDYLKKVISRSAAMRRWSSNFTISYTATFQMPLYLKDILPSKELDEVRNDVERINESIVLANKQKDKLNEQYKRDLEAIDLRVNKEITLIRSKSQLVAILSIKQELLPLSIQMSIEAYRPIDPQLDVSESRRKYARECLVRFKRALVMQLKHDPTFIVDDAIRSLQLK